MKTYKAKLTKINFFTIFTILLIILVGCKSNDSLKNNKYEEIINTTNEEIKRTESKNDDVIVVYLDNDGTILQTNQYKKSEVVEEYTGKLKSKIIKGISYSFNSWKKIYSDNNNIFYLAIYNYPNLKDLETETIIYESNGSGGSGSTSSNKAVIKYLNENGQSTSKSFNDGLIITLDAGSGNLFPSPINNQTIKLYVPKSQVLDLINDVVHPAKTNHLFNGYQYNEGTNTFTAQYVEAALVKYFDYEKGGETYEYFLDGTEIILNAGKLKYNDTSINTKKLSLTKGLTYDLTQSSNIPDLMSKYSFLGYKFNKTNNTFTSYVDFDVQIGDILTLDGKDYRVLDYDISEHKAKLFSMYSVTQEQYNLDGAYGHFYKDSNVYNVCNNYYNNYLKSKFPNLVPFYIANQIVYDSSSTNYYPPVVVPIPFNETVYCSLLRVEDIKAYDEALNALGTHYITKLFGSEYEDKLIWLLDGASESEAHSLSLDVKTIVTPMENLFSPKNVTYSLDVNIVFYTKLTDDLPFTITYGYRS